MMAQACDAAESEMCAAAAGREDGTLLRRSEEAGPLPAGNACLHILKHSIGMLCRGQGELPSAFGRGTAWR